MTKNAIIDWKAVSADPGQLRVNVTSRYGFLADIEARLRDRNGFAIATLNLDHLVKLQRDEAFGAAYRAHSHVTADGNPIVWLSRMAGRRIELLPGSDLILPIAQLAAQAGRSVALFGSTPQALAGAEDALCRKVPGLKVSARIAPPMGFDPTGPDADAAIDRIAASGAGLCFLALGAPKQEIFAARASARLPQTGFLSIGAGLDFLAGSQKRAPRWVRAIAAEWIWRLSRNPHRLALRYAACFAILPGQMGRALQARRRS